MSELLTSERDAVIKTLKRILAGIEFSWGKAKKAEAECRVKFPDNELLPLLTKIDGIETHFIILIPAELKWLISSLEGKG